MDNAGTAIAEVQSLFINSQWVKPDSGRYFSTINPATEEAITQVPLAGERETDLAVAAARRAFGGFKQSGFGREFGQEVLPLYTETKTVWFQM